LILRRFLLTNAAKDGAAAGGGTSAVDNLRGFFLHRESLV